MHFPSLPYDEKMAEKIDPSKLKVSELKAELAARGADNSGLKSDLVARLQQILDDEEEFGDIPGGDEPVAAAAEEAATEEEAVAEDAEAVPAPTAKKAKKDDTVRDTIHSPGPGSGPNPIPLTPPPTAPLVPL